MKGFRGIIIVGTSGRLFVKRSSRPNAGLSLLLGVSTADIPIEHMLLKSIRHSNRCSQIWTRIRSALGMAKAAQRPRALHQADKCGRS